jgi:hypothetical protein
MIYSSLANLSSLRDLNMLQQSFRWVDVWITYETKSPTHLSTPWGPKSDYMRRESVLSRASSAYLCITHLLYKLRTHKTHIFQSLTVEGKPGGPGTLLEWENVVKE